VGIDPGATFGIAAVGLDGQGIALRSTMGGFSDAARVIEGMGTPSLVACDTNPAPEAALRLASYFSCRLFVPRASVREEEKRQVARGAGTANSHERDAYCAAVFAYRAHANRLRQIDALSELARSEKERIKHLLLRGVRVQDAFLMLREPEKEAPRRAKAPAAMKTASSEEIRARLESLVRENANLRMSVERLEEEKAALLHRLRLMENGVRRSVLRDSEFRKLRFQLQNAMAKLQRGLPASEPRGSDPMNRLSWKRSGKTAHSQLHGKKGEKEQKTEKPEPDESREGINSLGEQELDLERLVAEYRKGRR
jgi:predicted RNase H-like nuclease (RuvC/YqgF family)